MSPASRPPRLGRGLAALLGDASAPAHSHQQPVRMLPIAALRRGPFQPRKAITEAGLEALVASIRSSGILQPILVRVEPDEADAYQIIAGERRWRAAERAGLAEVPCLVRDLTDMEAMAAGLVENLQRQDLNPLEEAEGYRRLAEEFAMSQEEIGHTVGKSRSHVANTLRLLNLPGPVQHELRQGTLTAGHARALLMHPDPAKAALAVIARGLNVRQTEALVQTPSASSTPPASRPDADTRDLEQSLARHLGLRVTIRHGPNGGNLRIDYRDLDQLEGLVRLLRPQG